MPRRSPASSTPTAASTTRSRATTNTLYRRGFEVEDDVVGQQRFTTATTGTGGINYRNVRGAFVAGGKLYFASSTGNLWGATWNQAGHSIVNGTAAVISAAGTGWASRALFPMQVSPAGYNDPPVANASISCNQLQCSYDATASTDPEGGALTYDWDFGDGTAHGTERDRDAHLRQRRRPSGDPGRDRQQGCDQRRHPDGQPDQLRRHDQLREQEQRQRQSDAAHTVTVPTGTQVGDTLLLFFTANSVSLDLHRAHRLDRGAQRGRGRTDRQGLLEDRHGLRPGRHAVTVTASPTARATVQGRHDARRLPRQRHACHRGRSEQQPDRQQRGAPDADGERTQRHRLAGQLLDRQGRHHDRLDRSDEPDPALRGHPDRHRPRLLVADGQQRSGGHRRRRVASTRRPTPTPPTRPSP